MSTDPDVALATLQEEVARFVAARDWQRFHTPRTLAASISIEAAELLEQFQWLSDDESLARLADSQARAAIESEVADVLTYLLEFAELTGIDLASALRRKLQANETRFPVDEVRGTLGRGPGGSHHARPPSDN